MPERRGALESHFAGKCGCNECERFSLVGEEIAESIRAFGWAAAVRENLCVVLLGLVSRKFAIPPSEPGMFALVPAP